MNKSSDIAKQIGKLLVVGFEGKTVNENIKEMIHGYHVGGIILFARNIGTPRETIALTSGLQKEAKNAGYQYPLMICIDQENGVVRRLGEGTTIFPGAMAIGATDNPENAYSIGLASGKELKSLGINWNLAPVIDVNNNPENPVIGVRSFGESAEKVAGFGKATMKGLQKAGVITTLKHFPGHGDTTADSHLELPIISHSKTRLDKIELVPFKACIETGADTIMSAHVYFPAIDREVGVPATLSKKVITGLLREELGFNGVVTTDCLEMNAISNGVGTESGGLKAIQAGVDLLMVSHTHSKQTGVIKEIKKAVECGELDELVITKANQRVEKLKERYLNWNDIPSEKELTGFSSIIESGKQEKIAYEVYQQSVTIVKNEGMFPIDLKNNTRILVIEPAKQTKMLVEDHIDSTLILGKAVKAFHASVDIYPIGVDLKPKEIEFIIEKCRDYDCTIIGTLTLTPGQVSLIKEIANNQLPHIIVSMRSPYDLSHFQEAAAYITTYEYTYPAIMVAAGAIFAKEQPSGVLPVTIKQEERRKG
ncbi:beta-N-acetylhexosaminidase [Bacillus salacetis]|uniref:beta-N-acetylhexosaminidase n=1 Tax=Bacillus salacetis TaxID=2315464 RepID=A0A3A1QYY8_9BACI|nr:beta-N-acetylhexosaminidase [Bacillus salacetis]RIW34236.1 beta-N-acetylhexosaminidase [Bacillus salacetis]